MSKVIETVCQKCGAELDCREIVLKMPDGAKVMRIYVLTPDNIFFGVHKFNIDEIGIDETRRALPIMITIDPD